MDIELRNDRIPRNPFDRQFLDMSGFCTGKGGALGMLCFHVYLSRLKLGSICIVYVHVLFF